MLTATAATGFVYTSHDIPSRALDDAYGMIRAADLLDKALFDINLIRACRT